MGVQRLSADDWLAYRDIRLQALQADPGAFGSTYEREAAFDEATWRRRLTSGPDGRPSAVFVDRADDDPAAVHMLLGTAGVAYTDHHPAPMLVGMWVRPEARGRGSGRRLVEAVVDWVADRGESAVVLWVVRENTSAIRLYESCGFEATGTVDALPSNPCAEELEMLLRLGPQGD